MLDDSYKILYKNLKVSDGTIYLIEYPPKVREVPMVKAFLSPADIDYFKIKDIRPIRSRISDVGKLGIFDKDITKFNILFPYVYLNIRRWNGSNSAVLAFSKTQIKSGDDLLANPIFPNILGDFGIGTEICLGDDFTCCKNILEKIDNSLWNFANTQKFSLNRIHFFNYKDFYINPNLLFELTNETFTVKNWLGFDPFEEQLNEF